MVAEDFDCMTDIAKSRKLLEKEDADRVEVAQRRRKAMDEHLSFIHNNDTKALICAIQNGQDEVTPIALSKQATHNPNKITLSSLLNILDGIHSLPGRIIIFTTNCPDTLDEAFLRPGRIDLRIRFGRPTKRVMYDMMSYWYQCVDKMYIDKHTHDAFLKKWAEYEERIMEKKYRPCDIMNMMQIHGEDYDAIFEKLCSAE
jgi:SpoVK/Ycf46/Vps4 family AAA+-type ATPase